MESVGGMVNPLHDPKQEPRSKVYPSNDFGNTGTDIARLIGVVHLEMIYNESILSV